jgi:hypothetical protein
MMVMMIVNNDGGDDSNYQTDYRASHIMIVMTRLFSILIITIAHLFN